MSKAVFLTGATGYIGGATLAHLLSSPNTKSFSYSALVRSKEKAKLIESLGVRPVIASLDDAAIITAEAEKADIVIHTANSSDHLPSCKAILEGQKKRRDKPILIHISGTGVLTDDARGEHATDEIFSDLDPDHINALPDSAFHRNVDLTVLAASDKIRTHIVLPPTIYGIAEHELVKKGISNPISVQVPALTQASIDRKQAGMIGKGLNLWPNAHISDTTSAIVTILEGAIAGKTATGREGYYFGETGEHTLYDVSAEIGRALHAHGIGNPQPTPFTEEEIKKYFRGSYYMGTNSRCKAERTRQLGWSSTRTTADFLKSVRSEVDYILKEDAGKGLVTGAVLWPEPAPPRIFHGLKDKGTAE